MPTCYKAPEGPRKVKFWIRSSRGTNQSAVVGVPENWNNEQIKGELEEWCSQFGAWHVSDNFVHYGWDDVIDT